MQQGQQTARQGREEEDSDRPSSCAVPAWCFRHSFQQQAYGRAGKQQAACCPGFYLLSSLAVSRQAPSGDHCTPAARRRAACRCQHQFTALRFESPFRKLPFGVCKVLQPAEGRAEDEVTTTVHRCLTQIKPTSCKSLLGFLYRLCWGAESQLEHDRPGRDTVKLRSLIIDSHTSAEAELNEPMFWTVAAQSVKRNCKPWMHDGLCCRAGHWLHKSSLRIANISCSDPAHQDLA